MTRIAFGIEYVGTNYSGWQSQQHATPIPSIQSTLEKAIASVADHPISTICAGRTDAGVHAANQVIHCDIQAIRTPYSWIHGCNSNLPRDIRVLWMQEVAEDFSARRSAIGRHYKYFIYNNPIRPSLLSDYVGWYYKSLDAAKMHEAAQFWLGTHDFSSFRGAGCQSKSPVRAVKKISVERRGDLVIIDIIADAFLYHMVRNMVGALIQIGSGRQTMAWAQQVLEAKCRTKASITAAPQGLYLAAVLYPEQLQIPQAKSSLWFFNQD